MAMKVLCGDIGGTHSRLALAGVDGARVELLRVARYHNVDFPHLEAAMTRFLDGSAATLPCCLAVAGPTDGQHVRLTNLPWTLDAVALSHRFGFSRVLLINDFAAVGWGLDSLADADLAPLQAAKSLPGATRVALGAGTGLGVSLCAWQDDHYRPLPSEGGHVGFASANPEQDRLLAFLRERYGRASLERILSGPGLVDLYRFCLQEAGRTRSPLLDAGHPAEAISQAGLAGTDAKARRSVALFSIIYGQTAGDLALAARAQGGVFLAGGIAPKLIEMLGDGSFLAGFRAKGRFADWMHAIPVHVILDPDVGLKGAALAAARAAD